MKRILMLVNWMTPATKNELGSSFFKHWPDEQTRVRISGPTSSYRVHRLEKKLKFHVLQTMSEWRVMKQYDLVVAYSCQSAMFLAFCRALCNVSHPPLIVIDVEGLPRMAEGPWNVPVRIASNGMDGIVAFSSFYARHYDRISPRLAARSRFIPYGLDFSNMPEPIDCPKSDFIVALGHHDHRFRDWKTLLTAFAPLQKRVKLVVVGRTDFRGIDLGSEKMPGNVEFRPFLQHDELAQLVAPARFAIVPLPDRQMSLGQGSVLTLMGLKKAVVTSDIGGIRDYVKDRSTGRFYHSGNPDSLRAVITELLDDPHQVSEIEAQAYTSARTEFCEPVMVKRLYEFVSQLGFAVPLS